MIKEKLKKAEELGELGMVDEAQKAMEEAEALKKVRQIVWEQDKEVQADPAKMLGPDVRIADQKLRVCDICGAFLSIYDSDWRLADHFGGKLHLGYMQILFLQALYFCVPFRDQLLEHASRSKNVGEADENLLTCLSEHFTQDAHEFLNFLLNELVGILEKEAKASSRPTSGHQVYPEKLANGIANGVANGNGNHQQHSVTWVHKIFQGTLTNETRCLKCKTVTARDETFLDLSLDIEQISSITSCLRNFSSTETLNAEDKFFCDKCCSLRGELKIYGRNLLLRSGDALTLLNL
ncbi:unnamed protein product [Calypogeia fissa]